jgi:hypothetical protein
LLKLTGICPITKKAVFTRFQKCGEWLTPAANRYTGAARRVTGCIMR